ncbi:SDR family NAD(P)-dependent oxidoreductase [Ottowia sp.]|uniref:SDR family NAD(P)-dependent oxidoreductase n=1 Tax=Ottowia sp. TaxID=1898956 RepID=UPI003A8C4841
MTQLKGKTALVTGAAQGMGLAFAQALAEAGARVVLTDVQDAAVKTAAAQLKERGLATEGHALDVSDAAAWARVVKAVGTVNVLVNNAGVALPGSIEDCTPEDWTKTLTINATGPFLGCQAVIPGMKAAGGGSIINIASIFGLVGEAWAVAYCASKGAITQLTKSAAVQLAADGIRVNSVHPGFVATPMVAQAMASMPAEAAEAYGARTVGLVPMGRMAESDDLVGAVLFLAGDASRFMTGAQMVVDGGFVAR